MSQLPIIFTHSLSETISPGIDPNSPEPIATPIRVPRKHLTIQPKFTINRVQSGDCSSPMLKPLLKPVVSEELKSSNLNLLTVPRAESSPRISPRLSPRFSPLMAGYISTRTGPLEFNDELYERVDHFIDCLGLEIQDVEESLGGPSPLSRLRVSKHLSIATKRSDTDSASTTDTDSSGEKQSSALLKRRNNRSMTIGVLGGYKKSAFCEKREEPEASDVSKRAVEKQESQDIIETRRPCGLTSDGSPALELPERSQE